MSALSLGEVIPAVTPLHLLPSAVQTASPLLPLQKGLLWNGSQALSFLPLSYLGKQAPVIVQKTWALQAKNCTPKHKLGPFLSWGFHRRVTNQLNGWKWL